MKKRAPKTKNTYFTQDTEDAIVEYRLEQDKIKRDLIFKDKINYSFHKLAENIIHTFKFYYTDGDTKADLKHEVVTFLISKMHLYDKTKGKAFSYFGTIAKRYLIIYNEKNYKKLLDKGTIEEVDDDKKIFIELVNSEREGELTTFIDLFIKYMDYHLEKIFHKTQDAKIADAILELFRRRESLDLFNKKALFIYIREIVDVKTPQITKIIKKFKVLYEKLYNQFYNSDNIDIQKIIY